VHGLRPEYQERVNFVILDYDREEDLGLARRLGVAYHPAYALVAAGGEGAEVAQRLLGPQTEQRLRRLLDEAVRQPAKP